MKIVVEYSGKRMDAGDEYQGRCYISVGGKTIARGVNFADCPEDANLGRDLSFIYELPGVLMEAYEAGKRGEGFEIIEVEDSE